MLLADGTNTPSTSRGGTGGGGDDKGDGKNSTITPPPSGQRQGIELPGFNLPPGLREQLGQSVLDALSRYQAASEEYLKKKRDLSDKVRGATGDQRRELLDQIRSNRERFMVDTRDLRTEIHNQLSAERDKLKKQNNGRPGERPH